MKLFKNVIKCPNCSKRIISNLRVGQQGYCPHCNTLLLNPIRKNEGKWILDHIEDKWVSLCPDYPNLKGLTCDEIEKYIKKPSVRSVNIPMHILYMDKRVSEKDVANKKFVESYIKKYLKSLLVYDRDMIYNDAIKIGEEIDREYPGAIESRHSMFTTSPRGGLEFLSIFSYANDLHKSQIPNVFYTDVDLIDDKINNNEYTIRELRQLLRISKKYKSRSHRKFDLVTFNEWKQDAAPYIKRSGRDYIISNYIDKCTHIEEYIDKLIECIMNRIDKHIEDLKNKIKELKKERKFLSKSPKHYGDTWISHPRGKHDIRNVFIIDDIIASGEQQFMMMSHIINKFGTDINVQPVALCGRNKKVKYMVNFEEHEIDPIIGREILGIEKWSALNYKGYVASVFPWSIPDGESDEISRDIYGGRWMTKRLKKRIQLFRKGCV